MHLILGPLGLGLDLVLVDGDGTATEVARGLYVVRSDDGTLLRVYLAGLDLESTGIHLELAPYRSGPAPLRIEVDRLLYRIRLVVSDALPSTLNEVLPGVEVGVDDREGPLFISFPDTSLAKDENLSIPISFARSPRRNHLP